jgi:hypothetical protein
MPEQTVIVWDLESVPDLVAAARMVGLETATEAEVWRKEGSRGFGKAMRQILLRGRFSFTTC